MKTIIPLFALLLLVGCGVHSNDNQSGATNSTASELPASPGNLNNPTMGTTNVPAITNGNSTGLPTVTNQ